MNITTVSRILSKNYTKQELESSLKTPTRIFVANNYDFLKDQKISRLELELSNLKTFTKEKLCRLCSIPFATKSIYLKFRDSLVDDVKIVLDALIWTERLHQDEIETKYEIVVYDRTKKTTWNNYSIYTTSLKKPFQIFKSEYSSGWYTSNAEYILFLPPPLRKVLFQYYDRPANADFQPLLKIKKTDLYYDSGEKDIQTEIGRLISYYSQGQIKVTGKGRPAHATIGKLQRKLNLVEFFPEAKDKPLKNLRSTLLAGMLVTLSQKQIVKDVTDLIKKSVFASNYLNRFDSAPIIMYYLKGMGYVDFDEIPAVESQMLNLLKKMPVDRWISYENIEDYMRYNVIEVKPILEHTAANKLYYQYTDLESRSYNDKHYIKRGTYRRSVIEPFIKGTFFFYAAFGLVDIAYDEPNIKTLGVTAYSPYDGLKYVRLTPLGYYVSGNTNTYIPPKGVEGSEITLSEDSLTIIIDPTDELAVSLLEPYASQISPSRFQTDYKLFLKECRSKKELESKIKLFQQFISKDLPPNWRQFFSELRQKIDPLQEVADIRVFKIPTDNQALVRLIARDDTIKKLVVKAEGYHLLITKKNLSKFKKRLQEFGYFMTS